MWSVPSIIFRDVNGAIDRRQTRICFAFDGDEPGEGDLSMHVRVVSKSRPVRAFYIEQVLDIVNLSLSTVDHVLSTGEALLDKKEQG